MFTTRFIALIAATSAIMAVGASPFVARDDVNQTQTANQTQAADGVDPASALAQSELAAFNAIDITAWTSDLSARTYSTQPSYGSSNSGYGSSNSGYGSSNSGYGSSNSGSTTGSSGGLTSGSNSGYNSGSSNSCSSAGCNEQDILAILNSLKGKVAVSLKYLDGRNSPIGPVNTLIADLNSHVKLLGAVRVNTSTYGSDCHTIISLVGEIIAGILGALSKYTLWTVLFLCIKIDIVICSLLKSTITLIPGILSIITTTVKPQVPAFHTYGFTSTLKACGY